MSVRPNARLSECVFWLHVAAVAGVILSGVWMPLWMVVGLLIIHRMQFMYFGGCLLSRLQHRLKPFPPEMGFLELAWFRLTGFRIDFHQGKALDAAIVSATLVIAIFV